MAEKSEAIQPIGIPAAETMSDYEDLKAPGNDDFEVFKKSDDAVDFRTVGWPHASIILLKSTLPLFSSNAVVSERNRSWTLTQQTCSPICSGGLELANSPIHCRRSSRCTPHLRMGSLQHVLSRLAWGLPKPASRHPHPGRDGLSRWRHLVQGAYGRTIHYRQRAVRVGRSRWCVHRHQCSEPSCRLYRVVGFPGHGCGGRGRQYQKACQGGLYYVGWLHQSVCGNIHRRVSINPPRTVVGDDNADGGD